MRRTDPLVVAAGFAAVACAIYGASLRGGFLDWDDQSYVTANPEQLMFRAHLAELLFKIEQSERAKSICVWAKSNSKAGFHWMPMGRQLLRI